MWRHKAIRVLPDIARHWARERPDKIALTDGVSSRTYRQFDERSNQIAHALAGAGIGAGERVGYVGRNSIEFWETWLGANKAGVVFVPLNWRFAIPEFVALVDDAGLSLVFAESETAPTMHEVAAAAAAPLRIVEFGAGAGGAGSLEEWISGQSTAEPGTVVPIEATSLLSYTSGTTGRPKGAYITHEAFNNWFMMAALEPTEQYCDDDVVLMVMPNFHLAGSWLTLSGIYHGNTIAVLGQFEPVAFVRAVQTLRPTVMCLVPTVIGLLVHNPDLADADFSSVRRILYAGSAIAPDVIALALERFGCELEQFYGTTETYIITILRPEAHDHPDDPELLTSCGSPFPFVEVKVVDAAGAETAAGTVGEVLVRSPIMIRGYWNNPEATAAAFDGEWYRTGDLGRKDGSGNLYLVDRAKDMIVTGGENVYSVEVEKALSAHPAVAAVAVLGTPSDRWGEQVTAFVVTAPGASAGADELVAHCRPLIAGYKVPKQIIFVEQLPTTPSGKIRKNVLRESVAGELETAGS